MKPVIAIDPGASGAFAFRDESGRVWTEKMPDTPRDIFDLLDATTHGATAYMERVGGYMPGNSGPAAAKFARHCGHLDMALIASGTPYQTVAPQVWMRALGALPKDKAARKNAIKAAMQARYPGLKVTLGNADALGILTWAAEREGK